MKITNKLIGDFLGMTPQGAGKWKNEERDVILFIEKYLKKNEIEEFLQTGKIQKLEAIKDLEPYEIKILLSKQINTNDIMQKLSKFQRRSLSYLYFLIDNMQIRDLDEFKAFIRQDITDAQEKSWFKFIKKHLLSVKIELKSDQISFNTFAQEFKNIYHDYINENEIEFILKNEKNRDDIKTMIHFILENKLYKI